MCGRITNRATPEQLANAYQRVTKQEVLEIFRPRFNVGPQSLLPVIRSSNEGAEWAALRWGLVPFWAKDPSIGNSLINARAETVDSKPAFRAAFQKRRCLVPVDGFYEWKKLGPKQKQPYHIHLREGGLFTLAGLWESWRNPEGEIVETCTVVTTDPNELMAEMHDRMPVIVTPEEQDLWLFETDTDVVRHVLRPYPAEEMRADPVSTVVNNVRNDGPECLATPDLFGS